MGICSRVGESDVPTVVMCCWSSVSSSCMELGAKLSGVGAVGTCS